MSERTIDTARARAATSAPPVPAELSAQTRALIAAPQVNLGGSWSVGAAEAVVTAVDPYTEHVLGDARCASDEQVDQAIRAARGAVDGGRWSGLSPADRSRLLHRAVDVFDRHRRTLAEIVTAETGSPITLTHAQQIAPMLEHLAWFADAAARGPRGGFEQGLPTRRTGSVTSASMLVREPIGVVAALTPYNAPLVTAVWKVGGALASGSAAVLMPSPLAVLSSLVWARLLGEADLPDGAFSFLVGDSSVGQRLTASNDVDMVTFTGSTEVGRQVARQASSNLKRLVLELGGKSPNVLLPGADVEAAAEPSALRFLRNAGQACGATTRTFVPSGDYEHFVDATRTVLPSVAVGDPWRADTVVGPLISAPHRDRVEAFVERAVATGGVVEAGGGRPQRDHGYFLAPTLVGHVDNAAEIAREELFGPVGVVIPYDDVASAIAMANDSPYGLGANVWGPPGPALEVARRIRSGTVTVNGGGGGLRPDAPFGGYRQSGIGREAGEEGFGEFFEVKQLQWPVG